MYDEDIRKVFSAIKYGLAFLIILTLTFAFMRYIKGLL
jgi:hypothetical protein